jgi:hypothetical protein
LRDGFPKFKYPQRSGIKEERIARRMPSKFESSSPLTSTENLMSIRKQAGAMLATLLFAGAALAQAPDAKPVRIRGDIVSLQGDILTVHRRSGDTVSIEVKPDV